LRREVPDKDRIYYSYVVDSDRKLIGFLSLKDRILARPEKRVAEIMRSDLIFAHVTDDQEDAARKIAKYDLIALPVANGNHFRRKDELFVDVCLHGFELMERMKKASSASPAPMVPAVSVGGGEPAEERRVVLWEPHITQTRASPCVSCVHAIR
jgi:CBS domain-containing protein